MGNLNVLLLCDVVDSTQLASSMPADEHTALWTRHDREARALIRRWRGREIDKTDGFLLLFGEVADALGFAGEYQAALTTIDARLQARIGIHAGEFPLRAVPADEVARGAKPIEIEGMARWVVARVAGVAPAGATVLCAAAAAALTPDRVSRSIGFWRMKGLPEPMQLFAAGDLPAEAHIEAPKAFRVVKANEVWLPARMVPHSLPAERDRFVGRRQDLDTLHRHFADGARLVTVLGMGGGGKTRLAQRFGWTALGDYPGGVWFCDLSQARSLDAATFAVAQGLGVPLEQGDPVTQLAHAIAGRGECLLVLDNFEQLTAFAQSTVGAWLDASPRAQLLVTSREVLGLAGEHVVQLPPLREDDAVALFMLRAEAATSIRPGDTSSVTALVDLLDRLPLAIELAAARSRLMTPAQLLARMRDRFLLLATRSGRPQRHATLRATIDWSWDLLSPAERSALAQLSVFEGGITLDAADAVLDLGACSGAPTIQQLMQSLAEKSLLRVGPADRADLLISVREYAADRLVEPGAFPSSGVTIQANALARHWRYFASLDEAQCIANGCAEADNLMAACRRATTAADGDAAATALENVWHVLALRGPYATGEQLARGVQGIEAASAAARARAHYVGACALFMLGNSQSALQRTEDGLRFASPDTDAATSAALFCLRGELLMKKSRHTEAAADLERAKVLARRTSRPALMCRVQNAQALLARDRADYRQAREFFEQGLLAARAAGDARWEAGFLGNLALIDYAEGHTQECLARYEKALELSRTCGDVRWEGNAACNVGLLLYEQNEFDRARIHLERALHIARLLGHRRLECTATCNLGLVKEGQGEFLAALQDLEAALDLAVAIGDLRNEVELRIPLALAYARAGRPGEALACIRAAEHSLDSIKDTQLRMQIGAARLKIENERPAR